eukprot:TRINITY_DN1948_c1_g4_i1.p1 TRINITY_DN1948_c1_g4~~TRINITY_DN1948_c1_g4_i1.p1  ORF type:complete len:1643 (-),score=237.66 TRINITY_DN1948_c1_g4_i1:202-5130(-)
MAKAVPPGSKQGIVTGVMAPKLGSKHGQTASNQSNFAKSTSKAEPSGALEVAASKAVLPPPLSKSTHLPSPPPLPKLISAPLTTLDSILEGNLITGTLAESDSVDGSQVCSSGQGGLEVKGSVADAALAAGTAKALAPASGAGKAALTMAPKLPTAPAKAPLPMPLGMSKPQAMTRVSAPKVSSADAALAAGTAKMIAQSPRQAPADAKASVVGSTDAPEQVNGVACGALVKAGVPGGATVVPPPSGGAPGTLATVKAGAPGHVGGRGSALAPAPRVVAPPSALCPPGVAKSAPPVRPQANVPSLAVGVTWPEVEIAVPPPSQQPSLPVPFKPASSLQSADTTPCVPGASDSVSVGGGLLSPETLTATVPVVPKLTSCVSSSASSPSGDSLFPGAAVLSSFSTSPDVWKPAVAQASLTSVSPATLGVASSLPGNEDHACAPGVEELARAVATATGSALGPSGNTASSEKSFASPSFQSSFPATAAPFEKLDLLNFTVPAAASSPSQSGLAMATQGVPGVAGVAGIGANIQLLPKDTSTVATGVQQSVGGLAATSGVQASPRADGLLLAPSASAGATAATFAPAFATAPGGVHAAALLPKRPTGPQGDGLTPPALFPPLAITCGGHTSTSGILSGVPQMASALSPAPATVKLLTLSPATTGPSSSPLAAFTGPLGKTIPFSPRVLPNLNSPLPHQQPGLCGVPLPTGVVGLGDLVETARRPQDGVFAPGSQCGAMPLGFQGICGSGPASPSNPQGTLAAMFGASAMTSPNHVSSDGPAPGGASPFQMQPGVGSPVVPGFPPTAVPTQLHLNTLGSQGHLGPPPPPPPPPGLTTSTLDHQGDSQRGDSRREQGRSNSASRRGDVRSGEPCRDGDREGRAREADARERSSRSQAHPPSQPHARPPASHGHHSAPPAPRGHLPHGPGVPPRPGPYPGPGPVPPHHLGTYAGYGQAGYGYGPLSYGALPHAAPPPPHGSVHPHVGPIPHNGMPPSHGPSHGSPPHASAVAHHGTPPHGAPSNAAQTQAGHTPRGTPHSGGPPGTGSPHPHDMPPPGQLHGAGQTHGMPPHVPSSHGVQPHGTAQQCGPPPGFGGYGHHPPGYGPPPSGYWAGSPGVPDARPPPLHGWGGPPQQTASGVGGAGPLAAAGASGQPPSSGSGSTRTMPSVSRRSLADGIDGVLNEIRHVTTPQAQQGGGPLVLEMLDLCACGLDDLGAQKLFEVLTRLQVACRRLMISGNGVGDTAMTALSGYLWHSPEPLWELALSENRVTEKGVEEILRCLYNHPTHPPRLPGPSGTSGTGPAFPLRMDVKNNLLQDHASMLHRVESAGGKGAVQLYVTTGDGPAPPPVEANRPLPYLWVFLPRIHEQRAASVAPSPALPSTQKDERSEKHGKKEKERDREGRDAIEKEKSTKDGKDKSAKEGKKAKEKNKQDRKEKEREKEKEKEKEKDKDKEKDKEKEKEKEKDKEREREKEKEREREKDKEKEREKEKMKDKERDRKDTAPKVEKPAKSTKVSSKTDRTSRVDKRKSSRSASRRRGQRRKRSRRRGRRSASGSSYSRSRSSSKSRSRSRHSGGRSGSSSYSRSRSRSRGRRGSSGGGVTGPSGGALIGSGGCGGGGGSGGGGGCGVISGDSGTSQPPSGVRPWLK